MRCSLLGIIALLTVALVFSPIRGEDSTAVNKLCPVGKEAVDGKTFATYKGKTIGFCCPGCDDQFATWSNDRKDRFLESLLDKAEPASKPKEKETPKSRPWSEPYPFAVCLVSGKRLGSMGDPVIVDVEGREVRLCCKGCSATLEKDQKALLAKLDEAIIKDQLRFYPLDTCIVTGTAFDETNPAQDVVIGNRLIRLIGDDAEDKLRNDPAKYIGSLDKAAAAQQRPVYPLDTCMVAGGRLGSMGDPSELVIAGRLFRFCCAGCEPKVMEDPSLYISKLDAARQKERDDSGRREQREQS